jgi:hypothetical protein
MRARTKSTRFNSSFQVPSSHGKRASENTAFTDAARARVLGVKIGSLVHFYKSFTISDQGTQHTYIDRYTKLGAAGCDLVNVTQLLNPCRLL